MLGGGANFLAKWLGDRPTSKDMSLSTGGPSHADYVSMEM